MAAFGRLLTVTMQIGLCSNHPLSTVKQPFIPDFGKLFQPIPSSTVPLPWDSDGHMQNWSLFSDTLNIHHDFNIGR